MPGFLISSFQKDVALNNIFKKKCIQETIITNKYLFKRNTLNKFMNDKAFFNDKNHKTIICDGVILNKKVLFDQYDASNMVELVKSMSYKKEIFFSDFRGAFSGAIYNEECDELIVYTSHYGDNGLFYFHDGTNLVIGSQVNYILDVLKANNINISLNEKAFYYMLTFGFMPDNSTYANEIKRLTAGCYLKVSGENLEVKYYYKLKENSVDLSGASEQEIIDGLDERFRSAVAMEFDKDIEYGYRHIADLSGGLDSRMTTWVAQNLGYKNVVNISYSQSGYLDETIAIQIAKELGNELLFKPLDEISFMFDVDIITQMNYGMALYCGITGGKRFHDCLNFDLFGIKHTGQLGDVIVGSGVKNPEGSKQLQLAGLYSSKLKSKLGNDLLNNYNDEEVFLWNTRFTNGTLSTHFLHRNYTEVASPFLNVDMMNWCFSIPYELRGNHRIYHKWILTKYPKAAEFKREALHAKITTPSIALFLIRITHRILKKAGPLKKNNMNPLDYWYSNNTNLSTFMNNYFNEKINTSLLSSEIKKDMAYLFNCGNCIEKSLVLSALATLKVYFDS